MTDLRRIRLGLAIAALAALAAPRAPAADTPTFGPEQLEQIVAPVALYPDSLLAQVFMASTYPLEVVEAARFVKENPKVEGQALEDALKDKTWDDSVKALAPFPQVLGMMNEKLDWTQKLGDAFLADQKGVMDAVQRLRAKANAEGNLKSNEQQKIVIEQAPTQVVVEQAPPQIIRIEPASPQVVYVPTYNPTVVYGAWPYPAYPPYYYYPPGYVAGTAMLSFGMGMMVGAAWNNWGNCNWGHGDIDIDVNHNYNSNRNVNRNTERNRTSQWKHDPSHRKGVDYRDKATQDRFGRGQGANASSREAFRGRAEQGQKDLSRPGGTERAQRDLAKSGGAQGGARDLGKGAGGAQAGTRDLGKGSAGAGTRDLGKGASQGGAGSRASGKTPSSLDGIGRGSEVRRDSSRGNASRQSASSWGSQGGGSRAGGSMGGSRAGGSMGGSRGGGGGGGRGGRR